MRTHLVRLWPCLLLAACGDNIRVEDGPDAAVPDAQVDAPMVDADPLMPGSVSITIMAPAGETGTINVIASRTVGSGGLVTVDYETVDGTATAGEDYDSTTGRLQWADGDTADKMFTIPLTDDLTIEGNETITVNLLNPTGGVTIVGSSTTATIADDDRVGDAFVLTSANRLVSFDRATPGTATNAVDIAGLPGGETILGLDARPATGDIYVLTSAAKLYTLDPATGMLAAGATLVADPTDFSSPYTGLTGTVFGIDFNPVPDRLRVVSNTGQNLRINVESGAVITDTALTAGVAPTAAAYTNSVAVACRTQLFLIDPTTDRLLLQNPPNDGVATAVGAGLGVDATAATAFDTSATAGGVTSAFAVLVVGGAQGLYSVNTTAGTATLVANFALPTGEDVTGIVLPPLPPATPVTQAPGELAGLTATRVVTFERSAPTKLCTTQALVGLGGGETPVGIDTRPSTAAVHVLTATTAGAGKLYTVDVTTGALTAGTTLSATLDGTEFGMDFNPTGPVALRIVSNTGQNLRVTDIATGATTVDTAVLNGTTTAAAYTDSLPGAGTTTLYVIDTMRDVLQIMNPPNAGIVDDVGPLGSDITNVGGFDIDGRDNTGLVAANTAAGTGSTLRTIDLATGALSLPLGTIAGDPLVGLTRVPVPSATIFAVDDQNRLVTLSLADPTSVTVIGPITGLATNERVVGLDVRPSSGIVYAVGNTGRIFSLNTATGAATQASALTADPSDVTSPFTLINGTEFGVDFNPTGPVALRIVSDTNQNLRVADPLVGNTFTDADLARAARVYTPVGTAYSNNSAGATTTVLYALDDTNDRLLSIASPNAGTVREIGPLGVTVTADSDFEIIGPSTAIATRSGSELVTIDLTTGIATSVGSIATAGSIVGIAAPPSAAAPAADSLVYAITSLGQLVSFARNAPGTVTNIGSISGLAVGESVEAFDIRPSTGELYILTRSITNTGRLYTVNATTGATTSVSVLSADPTDVSSPYTSLGLLAAYSIDFNPTGPVALRILGTDGSNLRVADPATGLVITDGPLGVATPVVAAAAYTNSFRTPAGQPTATSLFVIDLATASVLSLNPPNSGTLTPVGALSPTLTFDRLATFDIAGGNNGLAFATLQRTGESFSRLYRISLARGTATEIGTGIGGASGAPIRGMTIQVR